jgi:hypothetical protein
MLVKGRHTGGVRPVTRYKMTVVFDVHEEVEMKYVYQEGIKDKITSGYEALKGIDDKKKRPHINKLYEDIIERIERSLKHPITYDIVSFEKLREE